MDYCFFEALCCSIVSKATDPSIVNHDVRRGAARGDIHSRRPNANNLRTSVNTGPVVNFIRLGFELAGIHYRILNSFGARP